MSTMPPNLQREQDNIASPAATGETNPLHRCVKEMLDKYFKDLDGHGTENLYDLVLREVEHPLLESVMQYTRGNQSKAAALLGINRGTLRKKLKNHRLDYNWQISFIPSLSISRFRCTHIDTMYVPCCIYSILFR
jgi:Fis family transcriptional regulator